MKNKKDYKELYDDFIERLLAGDYILREEDRGLTELLFNSETSFPGLYKVPSYLFKTNYLSETLSYEIAKINISISAQKIAEDLLYEKIIIYHKKKMDTSLNQDLDYLFVIDSEVFVALGYKRLSEPVDKDITLRTEQNLFIDVSTIDIDEVIEEILSAAGLDVSSLQLPDKHSLFSVFAETDAELIVYTDDSTFLQYDSNRITVHMPAENSGHLKIRINSLQKPLIETMVTFAIKDEKKEYYKVSGTIISERTVEMGSNYQLELLIDIQSVKTINNLRAILYFLQDF